MKILKESKEKNVFTFEVEEDYTKVENAMDSAFAELVKQTKIPGFRQGKVPRNIFEKHYGKGSILEKAITNVVNDTYPLILIEKKLEPIDYPSGLDILKAEENQPLVFTISIPVKPDVKLGKYKGVKVTKVDDSLPTTEVDTHINSLMDKHAEFQLVTDLPAEQDNFVNYSVKAFENDEPIDDWTKDQSGTKIGSNMIHEDFDDNLIGMKIDETKNFSIDFPIDYQFEIAAGKTVDFELTLKEIRAKKLPELTDDFVKNISEHETVAAYKSDIETKLKNNKTKEADDKMRKELLDTVIEDTELDVPDIMVERELTNIIKRLDMSLRNGGLNLDNYIKFTGKKMEDIKEEYRTNAIFNVKSDIVVEAIAKAEKITPTDTEIEEELIKLAKAYQTDLENVKKSLNNGENDYITHYLTFEKTLKFLMENAKISK